MLGLVLCVETVCCRAMLCTNAAYAIMRCLSVRMSVCLPVPLCVTFMYSVEKNKFIFNFFSLLGGHTILVFLHQRYAKIAILDQYLASDRRLAKCDQHFDGRPCSAVKLTAVSGTSVYHADRHASVNVVYHSQHGRLRRREHSTILYAVVNLKPK